MPSCERDDAKFTDRQEHGVARIADEKQKSSVGTVGMECLGKLVTDICVVAGFERRDDGH